jgi:hypothetical protein
MKPLGQTWNDKRLFAFPPPSLLNQVVSKIAQSKCAATVVTPNTPSEQWFKRLASMAVCSPITISTEPGNYLAAPFTPALPPWNEAIIWSVNGAESKEDTSVTFQTMYEFINSQGGSH